ncbi:MAG: DEAD/DEAH box helicase [Bacteroidetes bacterium]|nr:DEAD/DEAH box helicase [Bacteroidota bacterium]
MIPSIVGREVRQTIEDYLRTSYRISTPSLYKALDEFIKRGEAFKGTYLSLYLPFEKARRTDQPFPHIPLDYTPYLHQERAFERLTGESPQPTIVATGTGSGKTEAFLLPILDYCRMVSRQPGIKAILIYPMNALATDQSKRIAHIIYNTPSLRGNVTAGLYIGDMTNRSSKRMTESSIITDRYALRESPPDLLLTNYKMLDYLMIRPKDKPLWENNQPDMLRFLVVDELHTFDGAQGTDLACLLRRLKARLNPKYLCPIGTSATLGSESTEDLRHYAGKIFNAEFDEESIITEERRDPGMFLMETLSSYFNIPEDVTPPDRFTSIESYIKSQFNSWFDQDVSVDEIGKNSWRIKLGAMLREHSVFQNLIKIVHLHDVPLTSDVTQDLFSTLASENNQITSSLLESFLSLISYALAPNHEGEKNPGPLLDIRIQLWMRELYRMVVSVSENPTMVWSADLGHQETTHYLPIASCIKCGSAGWVSVQTVDEDPLNTNLTKIYDTFLGKKRDLKLKILYPNPDPNSVDSTEIKKLCTHCLQINPFKSQTCNECQQENSLINVYNPILKFTQEKKPICPHCGERNQPAIFGARASGLLSASLGKVFASKYNQDKKVLAFSDSVQDAAHRAGYFESRTYSFSIRTALLQYIKSLKEPQNIQVIVDGLINFQRTRLDSSNFVGTFIAPNMTWMDDYQKLVYNGTLPEQSGLLTKVEKRLRWEIFDNLGLRARRGRTIEKTLSAAVSIDENLLTAWIRKVISDLRAEYGGLEDLSECHLIQFLTGLMYRLRTSGGIMLPEMKEYVDHLGGSIYTITEKHHDWMPPKKSNAPRHQFLSSGPAKQFLPLAGTRGNSWVQKFANRCIFKDKLIAGADAAILQIIQDAPPNLLQINTTNNKGIKIWGIQPSAMMVSTDVSLFKCKTCSYEVTVPASDEKIWQEMPCLQDKCIGFLEKDHDRKSEIDYYRELYGSGDVHRFAPREHTALLSPEQREEIEINFMKDNQRPWDPNIVSSTPTLELGIDIGDLSTVFLCGIPPLQSNYLQRIGRAGRKYGNSFCFSMATHKHHDQYFFAEPHQMIAGDVQSPGVFLRAPGVLRRQMAAFSFDRWIMHSQTINIPRKLRHVLGTLNQESKDKFPWNWLAYVETHADQLANAFYEMFNDEDTKEILDWAKHFYSSEQSKFPQLRKTVLDELQVKYDMLKDLYNRIQILTRRIDDLNNAPKDENYEDDLQRLQSHRRGLKGMRYKIGDSNVFNYLSDSGILPNYSFPQSSTTLNSTILPRRDQEENKNLSESFQRPGHQAIREFAPGNYFYANRKRVQIGGIPPDQDQFQVWRFCPVCSWHELESGQSSKCCPKCGSDSWGEIGQTLKLMRLSEVRSTSFERECRIDDRREERNRESFVISTHVKFNDNDIGDAYQSVSDGISFGFEFIKKCQFTLINHGHSHSHESHKMTIAGKEILINSFQICTECGKSKLPGDQPNHEYYCKDYGKDQAPRVSLSLYHDFESEAIRILLPIAETDMSTLYGESFSAALTMGLRECFRGKVDHLETLIQDEPISDEPIRRSYIYLYDTVPGGTGHLQGLVKDSRIINDILLPALKKLLICTCKEDPSKDGCYKCIFAYRNSFTRGSISRKLAINILEKIIENGTKLEKTNSVDDIDNNPLIESTLEELFLKHLSQWKGATLTTQYRGKEKIYQLTIAEQTWTVECQAQLGREHGVCIPSRSDFLITPESGSGHRPVAVFTDGFTYHRDQLADDTLKRMAILQSGRYFVWSLTWDDLTKDCHTYIENFPLFPKKYAPTFHKFISHFKSKFNEFNVQEKNQHAGNFDLLIGYLTDPDVNKWQALAYCHGVLNINAESLRANLKNDIPDWFLEDSFSQSNSKTGAFWVSDEQELHSGCIAVNLQINDEKKTDPTLLRSLIYLDDSAHSDPSFKPVWNGFLRAMNLFQFLNSNTGFFCASGLSDPDYYDGLIRQEKNLIPSAKWSQVLEESQGQPHDSVLVALMRNNAPVPKICLEIINSEGRIITNAEIAWPKKKVAFLNDECWEERADCEDEGWKCLKIEDLTVDDAETIDTLLKL